MSSQNVVKNLMISGLKELIREPKILFFTLFFPLFFLVLFYSMSSIMGPSVESGLSFIEYLFPGILIFALISIGFLGTSVPIIEMRQKGILKTFRTTPLKESTFVISQIMVRLILAAVQILIFVIVGVFLDVLNVSNIIPFLLISLLGMCFILILGFLMGGLFNNTELASGVLSVGMMPLIMLSGAMLPLYILPDIFETISYFIPFTYLTDIYHQILFDFDGKLPILGNISIILGLSIVFYLITIKTFKWL